jgi:hypothetical protein
MQHRWPPLRSRRLEPRRRLVTRLPRQRATMSEPDEPGCDGRRMGQQWRDTRHASLAHFRFDDTATKR